jgi:uncharacterized protein (DUF2461 family)
MGGGIRMPERVHLDTMREYISTHYKKIQKTLSDSELKQYFPHGLSDAYKLKKAPQGYDVIHPGIDLLRHKNFTIGCGLSDTDIKSVDIKKDVVKAFASLQQINAVLRKAGASTPKAQTFEYME